MTVQNCHASAPLETTAGSSVEQDERSRPILMTSDLKLGAGRETRSSTAIAGLGLYQLSS
ncbi:hypothetical protein [Phormidium tenue]|uniref:hypothetical protein n=1 Tax=Phormidium tenue TaxID=126344 RepID=UPI001C0B54A6|nr:hypothetical protein [Phormidium tenue]